jgi:SnoaL-like polyketide cyclase
VTERNRDLVRRAVEEIWNQGDLALADVLFAPTYVNHGGLIPDLLHGPEAIKSGVALYRAAFPDFYITVEALLAEEEMVDLHWSARRGPSTARTGGAAASQGGALRGTTRSRCAANQIAESWTTWDRAGVLRDLGLVAVEEGPTHDVARPCPEG